MHDRINQLPPPRLVMSLNVSLDLSPEELVRLRTLGADDPLLAKIEHAIAIAQAQADLAARLAVDLATFREQRDELGQEATALGKIMRRTGYTIEGVHGLRVLAKNYEQASYKLGAPVEEHHFDADFVRAKGYDSFKRKLDINLEFFRNQSDAFRTVRTSFLGEQQPFPTVRVEFSEAAKDALRGSMKLLSMVGHEDYAFGRMALSDALTLLMYGEGFHTGDRDIVATLYRDTRGQPTNHFTDAMQQAAEILREEESLAWQRQRGENQKPRVRIRT